MCQECCHVLPFAAIVTTRLFAVLLLLALGMPNDEPTLLKLLPCMLLLPTLGRLMAVRGCCVDERKAGLRVGNRTLLPINCEAILLLCGARRC